MTQRKEEREAREAEGLVFCYFFELGSGRDRDPGRMNTECRDSHGQVARGTEGGRGTGIQKARRKQRTPGTRNTAGPGLSREGWAEKKPAGGQGAGTGVKRQTRRELSSFGACGGDAGVGSERVWIEKTFTGTPIARLELRKDER